MTIRAVLFDLDDTLVPELSNYEATFRAVCEQAARERGIDVDRLRREVFDHARQLWRASPVIEHCRALGLGSPTSLLSDFPGDGPELAYLCEWAPAFRREAWYRAFTALGIDPDPLAWDLAETFRARQAASCPPFDDAVGALEALDGAYSLAVLSNGPADVQRAKLRASGLERFFAVVVVSSEIGCGKPDRRMFDVALNGLSVDPKDAVMVGDSLERDIAGARNAGVASVWLNRLRAPLGAGPAPDVEIASLAKLPSALAEVSRE